MPPTVPFIRASVLTSIVAAAADEGVAPARLYAALQLEAAPEPEPERWLPVALSDAAWVAATRLGPEDLPLRVARRTTQRSFGLLTYLMGASETVGAALRRLCGLYGVLSSGTRHRLTVGDRTSSLQTELVGPRPRSHPVESFAVAVTAAFCAAETGGAWRPHRVELRQPTPGPALAAAHEHALGAPVIFGAPCNVVHFDSRALRLPFRHGDAQLAEILEAHARRSIGGASEAGTRAASLRVRVLACLPSAEMRADDVAARLGLSERSLRRGLAAEGTTFGEIVAQRRSNEALRLLDDPKATLTEVAARLGYAGAPSFGRAFRRWFGVSPRAYTHAATVTREAGSRC